MNTTAPAADAPAEAAPQPGEPERAAEEERPLAPPGEPEWVARLVAATPDAHNALARLVGAWPGKESDYELLTSLKAMDEKR